MSMTRMAANNLSTLLVDPETGDYKIRLSIWVDPEALEFEADFDDREPTQPVRVKRGRNYVFGKIDTKAYKAYMAKDIPNAAKPVPMPTDGGAYSDRERMYR